MQFLNRTWEFNRFNSSSWEVKLLKILKCFKGSAEIWAEVHNVEWGSYEDFEVAFRNKYWSEEDQEILRSKIMGNGNFCRMNNHLTIYVMNIYNEAKYLEPPLPFRSFVRHVSKHLPREVQITLMTKEITNINELENMLDVLQNIGEGDIGRRPNTPVVPNYNNNYHQSRGCLLYTSIEKQFLSQGLLQQSINK